MAGLICETKMRAVHAIPDARLCDVAELVVPITNVGALSAAASAARMPRYLSAPTEVGKCECSPLAASAPTSISTPAGED